MADNAGRILAVPVPPPNDPTWSATQQHVESVVEECKRKMLGLRQTKGNSRASTLNKSTYRGPHDAWHEGVSMGGGQMVRSYESSDTT